MNERYLMCAKQKKKKEIQTHLRVGEKFKPNIYKGKPQILRVMKLNKYRLR